jgi:hypothetical protein
VTTRICRAANAAPSGRTFRAIIIPPLVQLQSLETPVAARGLDDGTIAPPTIIYENNKMNSHSNSILFNNLVFKILKW